MSGKRVEQELVQELEQELRQALTIEPSADFARQVRARIDRAQRPMPWRFAVAAAAMCIAAVGLAWLMTRSPSDVRVAPTSTQVGVDVRLESEAERPPDNVPHTRGSGGRPAVRLARAAPEPEVIVPPDRARALARLLELVRSGALDEESIRPVISAAAPGLLEVAPIVIPSISLSDVEIQSAATPRGGADRE